MILLIIEIVILIGGMILLLHSLFEYKKVKNLKIEKTNAHIQLEQEKTNLENNINTLNSTKEDLQNYIQNLYSQKDKLLEENRLEQEHINTLYQQEKDKIQSQIQTYRENSDYASKEYLASLEKAYIKAEQEFDVKIAKLKDEETNILINLNKIKSTLQAAIDAQLREKEKEDNIKFYTIQMEQKSSYEIGVIKSIEPQLADPRPLNMLIWTTYYSKKVNDLCSRVLGKTKKMGIYKITNIYSKKCYIGQAKDIRERWREHCKCGLGIDAPANNELYKAMQNESLLSFSFELLEECKIDELNEKEKFYIDLYSSYDFGYNQNRGNK